MLRTWFAVLVISASLSQFVNAQTQPQDGRSASYSPEIPDHPVVDTLPTGAIHWYPNIMELFDAPDDGSTETNPYEKFLTPESVQRGVEFLANHRDLLLEAEKRFPINSEVFVAILRIESNLGAHTRTHQAVGVYASIIRYASAKSRKEWARKNLSAIGRISQQTHHSITALGSSYAGAFGLPQFLPTSYIQYAVDGDNDGEIDLFELKDAVWSIGNYLQKNGWAINKREAVYAYNHDPDYVDCVFEYAKRVERTYTIRR